MEKTVRSLLFCLILLLSLPGCRPDGVLSQEEMTDLLADLYLTDGILETVTEGGQAWDSLYVYGPLLEAHGVTPLDFQTTITYYLHHPRALSKVFDKVEDKLESTADRLALLAEEAEEAEKNMESEETERMKEREPATVREGVEPRIEKADKPDAKQDTKQDNKRRNSRKKLSKRELEELEKQLKQ